MNVMLLQCDPLVVWHVGRYLERRTNGRKHCVGGVARGR
jgi:hypothetical protein